MNIRANKKRFTNKDEPPPPPKRQGTGKPASDSAADPRPKRTVIKGGFEARKPRKRVEGRMGIKGGFGNRPILPKPEGGGFTTAGIDDRARGGMAGPSATGPIPFLPPTQPAASIFPSGARIMQPPTSTVTPVAPAPPVPPTAPEEPQGPFMQFHYPEGRFVGPRPIQAAATQFQGKATYIIPPGEGRRRISLQDYEAFKGLGAFEGAKDEDRAGMKYIDERFISYVMQRKWLDSEKYWNMRLGGEWRTAVNGHRWFIPQWEGKKLLGMGGNGLVGLWERIEDGPEVDEDEGEISLIPKQVKRVAVKQQKPGRERAFRKECDFMQWLSGRGKHVIQMYGASFNEKGQGTYGGLRGLDPLDQPVQRVFLDYCDGGDFEDFSFENYKRYTAASPCPERLIWKVFECLAKGCAIFENGNEYSSGPVEEEFYEQKAVHFDLKKQNVFVKNDDPEHTETPLLVIGDFGYMEKVANPPMEEDFYEWKKGHGTETDLPPEQYEASIRQTFGIPQYLGTEMNIWAIGKMTYHLINRGRECNPEACERDPDDPDRRKPYKYLYAQLNNMDPNSWILTQGSFILQAPYSHTLRTLVMQCLALDWRKRPNARQILVIAQRALGIVAQAESELTGIRGGDGEDVDMMELDAEMEQFARDNAMDLDD